jgi:acetylornithine aminotransferase
MAKGIASGFPMGACVARIEVAEAFHPGDHGSTFGGSNLAVAAAHATLSTLMKAPFVPEIEDLGYYFADKLEKLDDVVAVRGMGLMVGADIADDLDANVVVLEGLKKGFLLNATSARTLRFLPPLICTEEEIDAVVEALPELFAAARATQAAAADEVAAADEARRAAEALAAEARAMTEGF